MKNHIRILLLIPLLLLSCGAFTSKAQDLFDRDKLPGLYVSVGIGEGLLKPHDYTMDKRLLIGSSFNLNMGYWMTPCVGLSAQISPTFLQKPDNGGNEYFHNIGIRFMWNVVDTFFRNRRKQNWMIYIAPEAGAARNVNFKRQPCAAFAIGTEVKIRSTLRFKAEANYLNCFWVNWRNGDMAEMISGGNINIGITYYPWTPKQPSRD